jgi:selenocysteine lyase/cysteine desulfurase
LPNIVRASPHYYNTEDEIDRVVGLIKRLAAANSWA